MRDFDADADMQRNALMAAMNREEPVKYRPQDFQRESEPEQHLTCPKCKFSGPLMAFEAKEPTPDWQDGPDSDDMGDDFQVNQPRSGMRNEDEA